PASVGSCNAGAARSRETPRRSVPARARREGRFALPARRDRRRIREKGRPSARRGDSVIGKTSPPRAARVLAIVASLVLLHREPWTARVEAQGKPAAPREFQLPCDDYLRGLRGEGNFARLVVEGGAPFQGTYHLAEDVWLPAGTEVRCAAEGVVRYSDFSPSWTDSAGQVHWNLGNVIVVEHALEPPIDGLSAVCS